MAFHPEPFSDLSDYIHFPEGFINDLYQQLLEARPFFPGDTNVTGHCIDALIERLEMQGAKRDYESD
jgi:hypothetical protein